MQRFKPVIVIVGIVLAIFIAFNFIRRNPEPSRQIDSREEFPAKAIFEPQENNDGPVSVGVLPRKVSVGANWEFEVILDTHSVELGEDLAKSAALFDDFGTAYGPISWEGDSPGGHHRSGTLFFAEIKPLPKELRLIMRNIGGVAEREFRWAVDL